MDIFSLLQIWLQNKGYSGLVLGPVAGSVPLCRPKPRAFSKSKAEVRYTVSVFIFRFPFTSEAVPLPQPLASDSPSPTLYLERSQISRAVTQRPILWRLRLLTVLCFYYSLSSSRWLLFSKLDLSPPFLFYCCYMFEPQGVSKSYIYYATWATGPTCH